MYNCPNKECSNKNQYSDAWIKGVFADGTASDICLACGKKLVPVEHVEKSLIKIKTAGCTPVSQDFTH